MRIIITCHGCRWIAWGTLFCCKCGSGWNWCSSGNLRRTNWSFLGTKYVHVGRFNNLHRWYIYIYLGWVLKRTIITFWSMCWCLGWVLKRARITSLSKHWGDLEDALLGGKSVMDIACADLRFTPLFRPIENLLERLPKFLSFPWNGYWQG